MSDEMKTGTDAAETPEAEEAKPEGVTLSREELAARGKRNIAIAWSLVAFIVIVFLITVVRLQQNIGAA